MSHLYKSLTNVPISFNPLVIQTSVAIIQNKDDILLIKRKVNSKDPHSGQIAFPGGKVENTENSLQAAIRETKEEIGVNLDEKHHLGRIKTNYQAYYVKNKSLMIAAHLFQIDENLNINICENEVDHVIRLPLQDININKMRVRKYKHKSAHIFVKSNERQKYISDVLMTGFKYHQHPYYDLNSQIFYGLSWLILSDILQKSKYNQDVVDYTFNNYHYGFDNNTRKEEFFDNWFMKKRLMQFMND